MQKTNLNVSPYYDDFDATDNFHRVLFRPSFAVQTRELTTLQSILQDQIEKFGTHMFKEGAMVIPASLVLLMSTMLLNFNLRLIQILSLVTFQITLVKQSLVQPLVLKQRSLVLNLQQPLTHLLFCKIYTNWY